MVNSIKKFILAAIAIVAITIPVLANDNTTVVITTSSTGYNTQNWFYSGDGKQLDEEKISEGWIEDKYITSIAYTSHGWFVAMNKGVNWTDQSYKYTSSWPDSWIGEQRSKGYMITSIASSPLYWTIVVSKNSGYWDQQICAAPWTRLKDWIKKQWDSDHYITGISYHDGLWTVVMSKTNKYTAQAYMWANTADDISEKIKGYWDKGYIITALEYGGGEFFAIMSKTPYSEKAGQSRFIKASESPESFIDEAWKKGWSITYIGG